MSKARVAGRRRDGRPIVRPGDVVTTTVEATSSRPRISRARVLASLLSSFMVEALIALSLASLISGRSALTLSSWAWVVITIVFGVEVHEFAHALVGIAVGGRFAGFVVTPRAVATKFRPEPLWDRQPWRVFAMLLAGPIAGLALGMGLVWVGAVDGWSGRVPWPVVAGWACIVTSLVNLYPTSVGARLTDGRKILLIYRWARAQRSAAA